MKRFLLSTAVLALTSAPELATAQPLPPPPIWTGFYIGLNNGYGFGTNDNTQSIAVLSPAAQVPVFLPDQGVTDPLLPAGVAIFNTGVGYALSGNAPMNQSGFIGGGQIGYNYQLGSNFIIGFEADIQGSGIRGGSQAVGVGSNSYASNFSNTSVADVEQGVTATTDVNSRLNGNFNSIGATSVNAGVRWLGTVRGRVGYLVTPTLLAFATGGLTYGGVYANVRHSAIETSTVSGSTTTTTTTTSDLFEEQPPPETQTSSFSNAVSQIYVGGGSRTQTLVGWNIGGGLEWMFLPNWSLKTEAIYWNMGSMNVQTVALSVPNGANHGGLYGSGPQQVVGATRVNYQGVIARLGLNYHFNLGGTAPVFSR